jgi:hypothetical protein
MTTKPHLTLRYTALTREQLKRSALARTVRAD